MEDDALVVQDFASAAGFEKRRPDAPPHFFEAEAAGLRWLASAREADPGAARVVRVRHVEPGRIVLEPLAPARPSPQVARTFGAALARTHAAGAPAFGSPPDGWDGPCFIGRQELETTPTKSWATFYAEQRVLPYLRRAVDRGHVGADGAAVVERACGVLTSFEDADPPARIHGDLWNGNVFWSSDGAVLIDPAAHGGHRETDLAMLDLFGLPYLDEVFAGYLDVFALRDGWRERIPIHQLHPLAVHAASHGPAYAHALVDAARRTIALGR